MGIPFEHAVLQNPTSRFLPVQSRIYTKSRILWHFIFMATFPMFPKTGLARKKRKSSESLYIHENRKYVYLWLGNVL